MLLSGALWSMLQRLLDGCLHLLAASLSHEHVGSYSLKHNEIEEQLRKSSLGPLAVFRVTAGFLLRIIAVFFRFVGIIEHDCIVAFNILAQPLWSSYALSIFNIYLLLSLPCLRSIFKPR